MKFRFLLLLGLLLAGAARAQVTTGYDPAFDARERERIAAERAQAIGRFDLDEADCYQRFAVNDCLTGVRRRKRVVMEELRRQEVLLNDQKRAAAAAAEQRRINERQAEREGPDAQARRNESRQSYDERQDKAQARQDEATAHGPVEGGGTLAADPALPGEDAAARRADNARAFDEKQKQAQEHREAHDRDLATQGQPVGKPLPVQPAQP